MERRKKAKKERKNPGTNSPPDSFHDQTVELTAPKHQDSELFSFTHTEIYPVEIMNARIQASELYEEHLQLKEKAPEKGMLAAMIERAILDLKQPSYLIRKHAEKWLFEHPTNREFGIYWCLEWLDMLCGLDRLRVKCRSLINDKTAQLQDAERVCREFFGEETQKYSRAVEAMFKL